MLTDQDVPENKSKPLKDNLDMNFIIITVFQGRRYHIVEVF